MSAAALVPGLEASLNPFASLKDKPKEERMEIARKLLKSMESELAEVMANALSPDASGPEKKNLQDVVLGALLQEGRNANADAKGPHREGDEKSDPASKRDEICNVSETDAEKTMVLKALKVAMQKDQSGLSGAKAAAEATTKAQEQTDAAKSLENDSSEIASILHALKNQTEKSDRKPDDFFSDGSAVRALTVEEMNAADALQKATMISAAGAWQGQSVFPPAARTSPHGKNHDGPSKKGSSVPSGAVLTERDVIEIFLQRPKRALDQNGLNTFTADSAAKPTLLAEQYNVASKTIRDIWNRNTWLRLTRPFWNAEELAAAGEKPADAEGLIPAQTRKRGRPCGTKDAVPRTRSCRKRAPGEEDDGKEVEEKPKKKGGKKRPTLCESGNFQAFVSALATLGEREQQAAQTAVPAEPAKSEASDVAVKVEAAPQSAGASAAQMSSGGGSAAQSQQQAQSQAALMQQAQLQQQLVQSGMRQNFYGGLPLQLMAASPFGANPFAQQAGLNLPFISVPIIPPELWAAYGVNGFAGAGAGGAELAGLDMRNPSVAAAVNAMQQQQQQQQLQQQQQQSPPIHMPTPVHPSGEAR